MQTFSLVVITAPSFFPGEAVCLESLLSAGLQKLHIRKPGAKEEEIEQLLLQLSPCWYSRLVLHGHRNLTGRYAIPQVHLPLKAWKEGGAKETGSTVSASLHSWEELNEINGDFEYVFMSPLFDSISKPGYAACPGLLQRPAGPYPCRLIGLGGINKDNIHLVIQGGWDGAAVLGWIWEEPQAVLERYQELKDAIVANRILFTGHP